MNQEKIGKFISELRKEKNLTQDQLGEKLNINGKSISKWETGTNMPDISNLVMLSKIFNVSVNELLSGEKNVNKAKTDLNILNLANYYKANNKNKIMIFSMMIVILTTIIVFLVSNTYFINNFGKNLMYKVSSNSPEYIVNGYLIINPKENIFIIEDILYQGDDLGTIKEPQIKNIKFFLKLGNEKYLRYHNEDIGENNFISEVLDTVSFSIVEEKRNKTNIIDIDSDLENIKFLIEYNDKYDKSKEIEIQLKLENVYTNNQLTY